MVWLYVCLFREKRQEVPHAFVLLLVVVLVLFLTVHVLNSRASISRTVSWGEKSIKFRAGKF